MLAAVIALAFQTPVIVCPVTGAPVNDESASVAISGVFFRFTDESSRQVFLKNPKASLLEARKKGWTVGVSFFDPTLQKSVILSRDGKIRAADMSSIEAFSTFQGIVFPFAKPRGKASFDQNPESFVKEPVKFTLWCPIMRQESKSIEKAIGYRDISDVRYYLCCDSCVGSNRGRTTGPGYTQALGKAVAWTAIFLSNKG